MNTHRGINYCIKFNHDAWQFVLSFKDKQHTLNAMTDDQSYLEAKSIIDLFINAQ